MVAGQSAAIRSGTRLLHGLFTCAADSGLAVDCWRHFSRRSGRRLDQDHATNELFSRSKRCGGRSKHRSNGLATRKEHDRHHHRHRARTFRREWCVRPAAGCVEYDLGRKSQARSRHLGISAQPLSLICDGWRHLFPAARFASDRSLA